MPRTDWNIMKSYLFTSPKNPSMLFGFNETVYGFYKIIINHIYENRTLQQVRDALLPKLMSGELAVEEGEGG